MQNVGNLDVYRKETFTYMTAMYINDLIFMETTPDALEKVTPAYGYVGHPNLNQCQEETKG